MYESIKFIQSDLFNFQMVQVFIFGYFLCIIIDFFVFTLCIHGI